MRTIIALKGRSNSGKTTSIRILHQLLLKNGFMLVRSNFDKNASDFLSIFSKNGKLIGVTSVGDTYDLVKGRLREMIDEDCDVCVCACRSYDHKTKPGTLGAIKEFVGHSCHFIDKAIDDDPKTQPLSNRDDAEGILSLIDIQLIIFDFRDLDAKDYPKDEINKLFKQVGDIAYVILRFHKGKIVMRARPNYNGERFNKRSDYSFKPADLNRSYQRASTPEQTMFYASSIADQIEPGELNNMRIIGVAETIPMLRDKEMSGYQKISFGRWEVIDDLYLLAIVHADEFGEASSYIKELAEGYTEFVKSNPKRILHRSLAFTSFLSEEFSKSEIRGDYDYMISAIFSELACKCGLDGVFYPSVRVGGRGFNIAIRPEAVEKLDLRVVGECSIYKLRDNTIVGNDALAALDSKQDVFILKDLESQEQLILEKLGVKSVSDLI